MNFSLHSLSHVKHISSHQKKTALILLLGSILYSENKTQWLSCKQLLFFFTVELFALFSQTVSSSELCMLLMFWQRHFLNKQQWYKHGAGVGVRQQMWTFRLQALYVLLHWRRRGSSLGGVDSNLVSPLMLWRRQALALLLPEQEHSNLSQCDNNLLDVKKNFFLACVKKPLLLFRYQTLGGGMTGNNFLFCTHL